MLRKVTPSKQGTRGHRRPETTLPSRQATRVLEPGTYFWQVTAIDLEARRGAPSSLAKFTVRKVVERAASLDLTVFKPSISLDGLVTVQGRTEVNSVVTVDYGMGDDPVNVKSAGRHQVIVKARARDGGGVAEKTVYAETGTD